ncbi:MAG: N-acetyltransferase [Pseudomonadota bacterium]|nr:N-acetyltransferase [Pseudomonadota bacterium]
MSDTGLLASQITSDVLSQAIVPALAAFSIQAETAEHVGAREALLDRAMGKSRKRKSSEAIRRGRRPAEGLAFSAVSVSGELLGTLRLWHVAAGTKDGKPVLALLLGPLAVSPEAQGLGLGGALMRHAIDAASRLGHGVILLVGDPEYYERFGFSACETGGLAMPGPFEPRRLLALELNLGAIAGACGRIVGTGARIGEMGHRRFSSDGFAVAA